MVQKTFGIYANDLSGCRLFIEAGSQHIAAWFADTLSGSLKAFEFFQFEQVDESSIDQLLRDVKLQSKLMDMQMDAALIIWENAQCTCIPQEYYSDGTAGIYMDIIAGGAEGTILMKEYYEGYALLSRYPAAYAQAIKKHLAQGPFSHKYQSLLKRYSGLSNGSPAIVRAVFYPGRFIIIVIKNNVLQIVQSIAYSTAEDVLYSILHICRQYGIAVNSTPVIVCGLINTGSPLYETLYKYIDNVALEISPDNLFDAAGFAEHPAQYFLPFIQ